MNLTRKEKQTLLLGLVKGASRDEALFKKYFKSDHWKDVRQRKLAATPTCQLCRHRKATQVHHTTYASLFQENIQRDLDAVCAGCHRAISKR